MVTDGAVGAPHGSCFFSYSYSYSVRRGGRYSYSTRFGIAIEYEYRFTEYRFTEYRFTEYRFTEYRFTEYRFTEYEYDEIRCDARSSFKSTRSSSQNLGPTDRSAGPGRTSRTLGVLADGTA